jgi:hypothetical protein
MAKQNVQQKVEKLTLDVKKFQLAVKDIIKNGESANNTYAGLDKEFKKLETSALSLSKASKNSFAQVKDQKEYKDNLGKINTSLNSISSANSKLIKSTKSLDNLQKNASKKEIARLKQKQQTANKVQKQILDREVSRIKKVKQAELKAQKELRDRISQGNKKRSKEVTAFEKRQVDRRIAYQKRKEKELTNSIKKEEQKRKNSLTARFKSAIKTVTRFAAAYSLVNAGQRLFNELVVQSAKRAIALEKALADVAAIANLTRKEIDRLEATVFKVAGSTSLTAIEVVELQKQLAKLGTSVSDIENLTKPIALLSQALGEDAGGVAASLKKTLNQFQATTEESNRFANAIVGAVNETALSLNDLGTALQYVGPLAAQSGLSFETTASLIGILADNGFRASRAGTGLRNVLLELAKDGRPLEEFLGDLSKRNLDVAEATEIFGKRGASAAIVLANNASRVSELNEELSDNTRLLKANAKQMSSTQGQIDLLSSSYDRASIRLGEYITQTEFFIEIIERLDPSVAGQARAFKFLASASDTGTESFDNLTTSLINFNTTQEEQEAGNKALFQILREGTDLTNKQLSLLEKRFNALKKEEPQLRLSDFLQRRVNESVKDAGVFLEEVIDLSAERAKTLRNQRIEELATNESYQEALSLTSKLTAQAKEGVLTNKEQERVTEGLTEKLRQLQETRERSTDLEEIVVLEKRIALFEELKTKVDNLENSQEAVNKKEKDRIKSSLELTVQAIKDQEKVIEGLGDDITTEQYFNQVEVLNALFGDLESIKKSASERFGDDSEFADFMSELFTETLNSIQVAAAPDPFGDVVLDTSDLEAFNEDNIDINGVKKLAKIFSEKLGEAFNAENIKEILTQFVNSADEVVSEFNDTQLENTRNRLESEVDAIKNRYKTEEDILRSQLDNQLITESQFRSKSIQLRKNQLREENEIDRQIFEAEKKQDRQDAVIDGTAAIAQAFVNIFGASSNPATAAIKAAISSAIIGVQTTAQVSAINSRQFFPKKFEQGGMVSGPSHAEGGVPFTVQGNSGYEMEGGEFIVNKRATSMHRDLLERINNSYRTNPQVGRMKFANGGIVQGQANESVDYLKAIAEATTSTAIGVSRPVRAYVSDKDLRSDSNERIIRDRNDRI